MGVQILRRVALPSSGLYPLAALVWAVFAYGVGAVAHTSGFAAVYACALMLGNAQLPHRTATRSFVEGIGWIAQIGLFVMLGLLASPGRVTLYAVVVALRRPGCSSPSSPGRSRSTSPRSGSRCRVRHQLFLSWAGLRGAVPIVLATIPLSEDVPGAEFLFDVVLVFVIVFTCLQAPTLPFVGRLLGLLDDRAAARPRGRGRAAGPDLGRPAAGPDPARARGWPGWRSASSGCRRHTVVTLIIRGAEPFNPAPRERIRVGDELLIVTPAGAAEDTEERLRVIGRGGRLAPLARRRAAA